MRIAILGTRGVPPSYGGFETFAAELGPRLVQRGHEVTVYCRSHSEPRRRRGIWEGEGAHRPDSSPSLRLGMTTE
ncbi:MAG: glycosyltransferase, partial [Thermoanaerobaculia bacterium]